MTVVAGDPDEIVSVTDVSEVTDDDGVSVVEVSVEHCEFPPNKKTFTFSCGDGDSELSYDGMEMRKGNPWTFSEHELVTMEVAKQVAEEVARQRLELNDVLRERRPGTVTVNS